VAALRVAGLKREKIGIMNIANYKRHQTWNEQTFASKAFGKRGFCRGGGNQCITPRQGTSDRP